MLTNSILALGACFKLLLPEPGKKIGLLQLRWDYLKWIVERKNGQLRCARSAPSRLGTVPGTRGTLLGERCPDLVAGALSHRTRISSLVALAV